MEAFHVLSRGGACFDKQRFRSDVQLFNKVCAYSLHSNFHQSPLVKKTNHDGKKKAASISLDAQLPPELDFFKYAESASGKRKTAHNEGSDPSSSRQSESARKRRKVDESQHSGHNSDHNSGNETEDDSRPKHRVTAKGSAVPKPAETFEELAERYNVDSRLLANLRRYKYHRPTGVQAHGMSILLEVSTCAMRAPITPTQTFPLAPRSRCHLTHWYREDSVISTSCRGVFTSTDSKPQRCRLRCPCCCPRTNPRIGTSDTQ